MKDSIEVSVIIPTYNRMQLLENTLITLCNQSLKKEKFEVIIVDDGSTDNTYSLVNKYSSKINIIYIYQEHKGFGAGAARNKGIKLANGNICALVDSGILLASDAIEKNISNHQENNNSALIGYVYGFDETNEKEKEILEMNIDFNCIDKYFEVLEKKNIIDYRENVYKDMGDDMTKWPAPWAIFWTAYVSIKKDVLEKVGMFDESFQTWGCEDTDLGLALYINHVDIILCRDLKCIHYPHEKSRADITEEEIYQKKLYLHQKYNLLSTKLALEQKSRELNQFMKEKEYKDEINI